MYTPPPTYHIYECGILIQVLDDRRLRLYATHQIRHHNGQLERVWSDSHVVDSGSSQAQHLLNQLVEGLYDNFRLGLERFRQAMMGSAEPDAAADGGRDAGSSKF